MTELRIYRGLPASGKTTLARAWVAEDPAHRARSNRDDLRMMLHNGVYLGHDTEGQIVKAQDSAIRVLLEAGFSVACDDTNLSQSRARGLAEIARKAGAGVLVIDLTDVPLEVCLARNRAREFDVPDDAIIRMHKKYLHDGVSYPLPIPYPVAKPEVEKYVPKPGKPKAVMVDLDGTLCLHNGRSPYDESRVGEDLPNRAVVAVLLSLAFAGDCRIIFCSGRSEGCRSETEAWIRRNASPNPLYEGNYWEMLLMRQAGDTRKDAIVKRELFDSYIRDVYDVVFVLDDRNQVVDAWRELGLTVFQVAPGDF